MNICHIYGRKTGNFVLPALCDMFFFVIEIYYKYIIFVKWFYFLRTGNNAVENRSGLMRGERDAVVEVMTDTQLRR